MLEAEIGRQLKFHPDAEALLDDGLMIQDLVAGAVRRAFENFEGRPENVSFREWILSEVDGAIDEVTASAEARMAAEEEGGLVSGEEPA